MDTAETATPGPARISRTPSGAQTQLRCGPQSATVVEVGGALRSYTIDSRPLLDGYGPHERCTGARGQTLIPWPNRLRDGRYTFAGTSGQLPLTEPGQRNAIHGLVRWASWAVSGRAEDRVSMTHTVFPQPGWPFLLDLRIDYELGPGGLTVRTTAVNAGPEPCPYGTGAHPYLTLGTPVIDGLRLRAPGTVRITTDDRGIPAGDQPVGGTEYDFRAGRIIGAAVLDTGYRDLARADDGRAWVTLADDASGTTVGLWMDEAYGYLMLFTGDSLAEPGRRRRGLGVEPMTCAANALQTGDGLVTLQPGQRAVSAWGISPAPPLGEPG